MKTTTKTVFSALLVMLLWGALFPLSKMGFSAYDIVTTGDILLFAGVRFTVCGVLITALAAHRETPSMAAVKQSIWPILWSGVFAVVLHYGFTYVGLTMTDASKTAIMKQIGVLLYVCFSSLFFKDDAITVRKLIGVALGFVGIVAINVDPSAGLQFHIGDLLIIGASFCTVFSNVISKKVFDRVPPLTVTGVSQLFGGIALLAVGIAMGGHMRMTVASSWLFAVICLASIISYGVWFQTVQTGELSKLFIIKFAEPIFAAIFGAVLLGENIFRWQYAVAFLLIAGGIVVSNQSAAKQPHTK